MRISTVAIVLAVFAFGTHGYASLFSISANVRSAATWPTFVDARHVIKTVAQPLAQSPDLVGRALSSLPAPSVQPTGVIAAVVKDGAALVVPPLPVQSPPASQIKTAGLTYSQDTPRLKARVIETPQPARPSLTVPRPGTSSIVTGSIVTGSIRPAASPAQPPVATSPTKMLPARRPEPPFDLAARSSLGGPLPAEFTKAAVANTASKQMAALPLPATDRKRSETSNRAGSMPLNDVGLPARSPLRGRRPVAVVAAVGRDLPAGRFDMGNEPVLRPLGQSLAVVRRQPHVPHLLRPSRHALVTFRRAHLAPPLPTRMRTSLPITAALSAEIGASNVNADAGALAPRREAALTKRSKVGRGVARARPVKRRAYKVSRRAARSQQVRRRSARSAQRRYAGSQWKRQALGESLY